MSTCLSVCLSVRPFVVAVPQSHSRGRRYTYSDVFGLGRLQYTLLDNFISLSLSLFFDIGEINNNAYEPQTNIFFLNVSSYIKLIWNKMFGLQILFKISLSIMHSQQDQTRNVYFPVRSDICSLISLKQYVGTYFQ